MDKKTKELLEAFHQGTCIRPTSSWAATGTVRRGKSGYGLPGLGPQRQKHLCGGRVQLLEPGRSAHGAPGARCVGGLYDRGYEGCLINTTSPAPMALLSIKPIPMASVPPVCPTPPASSAQTIPTPGRRKVDSGLSLRSPLTASHEHL